MSLNVVDELEASGCDGPVLSGIGLGLLWAPFMQFAVGKGRSGSHHWDEFRSGDLVPAGLGGVEQFVGQGSYG
jgi:hypothetical protein